VVHTNLVVVANYFLVLFIGSWNGWVAGLLTLAVCPLMVSNYKSYKTDIGHGLAASLAVTTAVLALALEFGFL
jgi:CDP-diacylglycerol--serine O-phosphatidyltransferase